MRLGQEVLSKIENILTRIDQKESTTTKRKPRIKQQNRDINTYVKLYDDYKIKQQKYQAKLTEKEIIELQKISPFKITNKHTIFLNAQKQQPPIYQRLQQLQQEKFQQMQRLRQKYPRKDQMEQYINDQEQYQEEQNSKRPQKKYSQRQIALKVRELQQKEKQRLQRLNMLKIKVIQQHSKDFRCKPYVNKGSDKLWNNYKLKKQLSTSVFQRFQQYQMQRKTNRQKNQKKYKNQLTPFTPKISQNSRYIVSRSLSKSKLHQNLSRSVSCKCFQRPKWKKLNNSTAMNSSRKY